MDVVGVEEDLAAGVLADGTDQRSDLACADEAALPFGEADDDRDAELVGDASRGLERCELRGVEMADGDVALVGIL